MSSETSKPNKADRKAAGKALKRRRIEENAGARPRNAPAPAPSAAPAPPPAAAPLRGSRADAGGRGRGRGRGGSSGRGPSGRGPSPRAPSAGGTHNFGRVMPTIPAPPTGARTSTLSLALPSSVLAGLPTLEQRTLLANRVARAACIYHADEVVVYDDGLAVGRECGRQTEEMVAVLQYSECPQYLRRTFFPLGHGGGALAKAGWCQPVDAPHHCREGERSLFREGAVQEKTVMRDGKRVSQAHCGIRGCPVTLDRYIGEKDVRVTVRIEMDEYDKVWGQNRVGPGPPPLSATPGGPGRGGGGPRGGAPRGAPSTIMGTVVSPRAPVEYDGRYWGYEVRRAAGLPEVLAGDPTAGRTYDLTVGTSERGTSSVDDAGFALPPFERCLLVFGGQAGLEEVVDAAEHTEGADGDPGGWRAKVAACPGMECGRLFDMWVNVCPWQGSRTVRTEEAVLVALARLRPLVAANKGLKGGAPTTPMMIGDFSSASEESSDEGDDHGPEDDDDGTSADARADREVEGDAAAGDDAGDASGTDGATSSDGDEESSGATSSNGDEESS